MNLLDFKFLSSRTVREYISVVLSHLAYNHLLSSLRKYRFGTRSAVLLQIHT